jgi:integrase/recombinase XerD
MKIKLSNQRFKEKLKGFIQRKKDEGKSESNVKSVGSHAKEFLHFLELQEVYLIEKITQQDIDSYFTHLQVRPNKKRGGGLSSAYLNKHREAVLRFMEYFYEVELGQSPFIINIIKDGETQKEILTEEEIALLFSLCEPNFEGIRTKVMLSLMYGCGLRKSELFRLDLSDINLLNDTLRVQKAKNSKQRDIPLSPIVKQNLENYIYNVREYLLRPSHPTDAFLITNIGVRMSKESIHFKIKQLAKLSTIDKPISCHKLRHAIGTHLVDNFSLEEIALFLGHKSIDSTQIYTHYKYTKTK